MHACGNSSTLRSYTASRFFVGHELLDAQNVVTEPVMFMKSGAHGEKSRTGFDE